MVRHERDRVAAHLTELDPEALIVDQDEVPGTGRAVEVALEALDADAPVAGTVVVTYGDVPLLTGEMLAELVNTHEFEGNAITVLTALLEDAAGYGRILRGEDGTVTGIREHKDATDAEREIREINSGIYAFDAAVLRDALGHVTTDNSQGEKYLTDVLGLAREAGGRVAAVVTADRWQVEGANDRVQLAALGAEHNRRIVEVWMRAGVTVVDPATTWIDSTVTLAEDVRILPNTQLHGSTTVARDAVVGPDSTLTDVRIGEGAKVTRTHGSGAEIGAGAERRTVHLPAPRHRPGRDRQDRRLLRNQERENRPRLQAVAPWLRRGRRNRRGHQHRLRQHHGQLRRREEAPHGDRLGRPHRFQHSIRRTRHGGGRCLQRRRSRDPQGRTRRRPGAVHGRAAQRRGLGQGQPPGHAVRGTGRSRSGPRSPQRFLKFPGIYRRGQATMTEITARGEKKLVLAAGRAHPELAREIAKELGTELLPVDAYDFANGEIYVRAGESVRGTDAFVIQAHPAPLNNWLMEQLIMIDSLKRASAKRITVVSPFYPYHARTRRAAAASPSRPASLRTCTRPPAPTAS